MKLEICQDKKDLGIKAASRGAGLIKRAISETGSARIILATGASQFETLSRLVSEPDVDWKKVIAFHLDEYVGLPFSHPASFRKYLKERFADKVPIGSFVYIDGENNPEKELKRLGRLIESAPVDVAFVGVGENGHLAFNDPPADFNTDEPYIIVRLNRECKRQQVGEGWFGSVAEVPDKAISMSIRQIMRSQKIICAVPDLRKARAVKNCFQGDVTPNAPASILREHDMSFVFLDRESSSMLD